MDGVDEEMPELPPEVKINMKLDDIIKYNNMKAGVSHNLQFNRGKNRNLQFKRSKPFRPYFRRRYQSQNWRLRGNGPNTSRWNYNRYPRVGKVKEFLARKQRMAPPGSVFHRLGYNPLQEAAKVKVYRAKNYSRPRWGYFSLQRKHDPDRARKLIQSARIHSARRGDGLGNLMEDCLPVKTLNEVNLQKLQEVLGGQVTKVTEEETENGEVKTVITRYDPSLHNSFDASSMCSTNSYNYGFNQANIMNRSNSFNGMNSMNPMFVNGYNVGAMNNNGYGMNMNGYAINSMMNYGMNNVNAMNNINAMNMNNGIYNMNGVHMNGNSMYGNMQNGRLNPMLNTTKDIGTRSNSFNGMGLNQFSGASNFKANSLSRTINPNGLSQEEMIQRLNEPAEPKPSIGNDGTVINPNMGRGIDSIIVGAATKIPFNIRFGGGCNDTQKPLSVFE